MDFREAIQFHGFNIHHTLTEATDPDQFTRHCHNQYELIYISKGRGDFQVEGTTYHLYPGCFLVFRPQEFHCIKIDGSTPYERYVIHFFKENVYENSDELLAVFEKHDLGISNQYADPNGVIASYYGRLSACAEMPEPNRSVMARLILNELLVVLNSRYYLTGENYTAEKLIHRIVAYINENLSSPLKLNDLASCFFISRPYLSHMFIKHTGISVSDYITQKRLTAARGLIRSGMSASAAAAASGYVDYSVFYRAYVRFFNAKPSDEQNAPS